MHPLDERFGNSWADPGVMSITESHLARAAILPSTAKRRIEPSVCRLLGDANGVLEKEHNNGSGKEVQLRFWTQLPPALSVD